MNQLVDLSTPRVDGFNAELTLPAMIYPSGVLAQSEPGKLVGQLETMGATWRRWRLDPETRYLQR